MTTDIFSKLEKEVSDSMNELIPKIDIDDKEGLMHLIRELRNRGFIVKAYRHKHKIAIRLKIWKKEYQRQIEQFMFIPIITATISLKGNHFVWKIKK